MLNKFERDYQDERKLLKTKGSLKKMKMKL